MYVELANRLTFLFAYDCVELANGMSGLASSCLLFDDCIEQ